MKSVALAACAFLLLVTSGARADEAGARNFVDQVGSAVIAIIKDTSLSQDQKQAKLRVVFEQNADFNWIGQFVLGRHWNEATPEQQQAYLKNYRGFIVTNYADKFKKYSGQTYKILGITPLDEGESLVKMEIEDPNPNNPDISTNYKIRETKGQYKIFDIIVEGVSLITTQRSEFDSVVKRKGLDGLIELLGKKGGAAS